MRHAARGFTLMEVVASSLVVSVVAVGTMMAFVTASRLSHRQNTPDVIEAEGHAQELMETFRNHVATDDLTLMNDATASEAAQAASHGWVTDPAFVAGDESVSGLKSAKRCYRVTPGDCDGDGVKTGALVNGIAEADCYVVQVQVCWNDVTPAGGCECP